jgi:TolA-binding protein
LGCGWGGFDNSIRFGYGETDRERERLPPLPMNVRGTGKPKPVAEKDVPSMSAEQRSSELDTLWTDAASACADGELEKARRLLREYTERTADFAYGDYWDEPSNCAERRNSAFDRLDALSSLDRGSTADNVKSYLAARNAYDNLTESIEVVAEDRSYPSPEKKKEAEVQDAQKESARNAGTPTWAHDVEENLSSLARDPQLADNADYLRAAGIYRAGQTGDAVAAFESVAAKYPRSEKREAALYMAGLLRMKSSATYAGEGATATSEDPCREPECRDEGFTLARKHFARLLADYPRGRYGADARGWLAYLDLRVGDTADALVEYYRLLADGSDASGQEIALRSLRLVRGRADDACMDAVESKLEDEPQVALVYAYHNLYNYAAGYYLAVPEVEAENPYESDKYSSEKERWDERQEATLRSRSELKELRRVADFAARLMRRYPHAEVGGAFAVRLAGAQLELGDAKDALSISRRALSSTLEADERGKALWIEGVAEYRLKNYAAARRTLARLAEEFPAGDLSRGARQLLAMVAEDAGDLAGALEQYLTLGYDPDVAYFVDVLLTPEQLASFVEKHADSPRRDELLYALGLRYMRAGRYAEARATFSRVRTTADSYYDSSSSYAYYSPYDEDGPNHPKMHFRHLFWDAYSEYYDGEYAPTPDAPGGASASRDTRVYADWLLRDMKTLDDLERLKGEIERAVGDEAKAEAMYQLASYFYEGELLFYNPAAWRGMRAEMLYSLDETDYRSPGEAETVWRYVQEHESPARALSVYLDIVRLYPRTRAARDALYTAILCQQRLSEFNGYWREMYDRGMYAGDRQVTLTDLRSAYPNYRLPLVGDWEPSTRTVNGQAAWPAPPAPKKLTGTERVRLKVKRAEAWASEGWRLFGEIHGGSVRRWTIKALRWLVVALIAACVLLVFRLTRRTRRFLYRQLARCWSSRRAGHRHEVYAPKSSYAAHLSFTWHEGFRAAAGETAHRLARLALSERGRAALALNLFTHGLLTVVLWAVLWAVR